MVSSPGDHLGTWASAPLTPEDVFGSDRWPGGGTPRAGIMTEEHEEATSPPRRQGTRLLDVGAAHMAAAHRLADAGHQVVVVDSSVTLLARGRAGGTAIACCGDGSRLPFPDGCFDGVLITEVLEHVHEPAAPVATVDPPWQ